MPLQRISNVDTAESTKLDSPTRQPKGDVPTPAVGLQESIAETSSSLVAPSRYLLESLKMQIRTGDERDFLLGDSIAGVIV